MASLPLSLKNKRFVTIHPFEDGNGRIARAIGDLCLARSERSKRRFYSLSAQIQKERKGYYAILERTQKGLLDITSWMKWFLQVLTRAISGAQKEQEGVIYRAEFWRSCEGKPLNERQRKVVGRLLEGFKGKLTTSKWAKIGKCSQDTAYRDILQLVEWGILDKEAGGGRSTHYALITSIKC